MIELPSVSVERGEAMAERDRLQPGEPVAAAGAAEENRQLLAHQPAAEAGENRRPNDQARALLLALLAESHLTRRLFASTVRRIELMRLPAGYARRGHHAERPRRKGAGGGNR